MDIEAALLSEHSKMQSDLISTYIGNRENRFQELMALVLGEDQLLAQRAAWTMGHCVEAFPNLIGPFLPSLIELISNHDVHCAIPRNTLRSLQVIEIPEKLVGSVFELCYRFLNDPGETAAVRIYSMTILVRICEQEPDLAPEIELLIKQHLPYASAGYKSRAGKSLKTLKKLQSK